MCDLRASFSSLLVRVCGFVFGLERPCSASSFYAHICLARDCLMMNVVCFDCNPVFQILTQCEHQTGECAPHIDANFSIQSPCSKACINCVWVVFIPGGQNRYFNQHCQVLSGHLGRVRRIFEYRRPTQRLQRRSYPISTHPQW